MVRAQKGNKQMGWGPPTEELVRVPSSAQDPGNCLWSQVQNPSGCVSSGKLLNFSVPQFLPLTNGPLQEKDKLMWTKFFERGPMHSW